MFKKIVQEKGLFRNTLSCCKRQGIIGAEWGFQKDLQDYSENPSEMEGR